MEHVITIGWRGASDARIREKLIDADLLFLTQDEDFLFSHGPAAIIVVSRVRQARPLHERIETWCFAVADLVKDPPVERRFELHDDGALVPWEEGAPNHTDEKTSEASSIHALMLPGGTNEMSRAVRVLAAYTETGTKAGTATKNDQSAPKKRGRVSPVKSGVTKWRP